jgi:hypothetical protein
VRILQFYASPGTVAPGEKVNLCYGVENARSVRLEPPIQPIQPSPTRCIQFTPMAGASYKLIATGADGREATQSVSLRVEAGAAPKPSIAPPSAAPPKDSMILLFSASAREIRPGQSATICYGVRSNTVTVMLEPGGRKLDPLPTSCFMVKPEATTTYRLTVTGPSNAKETESLTVAVR